MATIRKATPQDATKINEITRKAFTLYADELQKGSRVKALEEPQSAVLDDIREHNVFVAEEDGALMGSLRIKALSADLAYLYRFGVDPTIRNTGVGSDLLQAAIDDCRKAGFAAIALHTNAKYYTLARYYYGKQFYVHSTSTAKGYIRALFVKELDDRLFDISPAYYE